MSRLPTPGGDADAWATILNDYLSQSLGPTGLLKDTVYFGNADTNLYRAAAGYLKTDSNLMVGSANLYVGRSTTDGYIWFGNALDIALFREAAGVLRANGVLKATAFTVAATTKPGEEPADEINLLTLIERLSDRVAELEAKLEQ